MPASELFSFSPTAAVLQVGGKAVPAQIVDPQSGADMLRAIIGNDTLLWGCVAVALIALVTVGKVASRRRKAGKASRMARARSDAVHGFLDEVRAGHGCAKQGMWHYDFATGAQQYSDNLKAMLAGEAESPLADAQIEERLAQSGLNLATLARDHFDETQPFEAVFELQCAEGGGRSMVLRACNFRGGDAKVQRVVGIISEAL